MAEFAHLPQDVRPIAALDAEARIRTERWVQHAAADRVLGYLQEAFQQPPRERMENILLVGESGMGKTMLVRKFERQNAAPFDDVTGIQHKPVVVMLMPHQPTEGQFFNQLLHALNAPSVVLLYPLHFAPECCTRRSVRLQVAPLRRLVWHCRRLSGSIATCPRHRYPWT